MTRVLLASALALLGTALVYGLLGLVELLQGNHARAAELLARSDLNEIYVKYHLALAEEAAERKRFERDVALARRIQVSFLPPEMPQIPGVEIYGGNIPSRGVSGDYYQVVKREDHDDVAVIIADVSGKGIAASLLTGYVDALFLAYLGAGHPPHEVFNRVSPQMNGKTPVEAFALGQMRTAALSSVATKWCAVEDADEMAIMGSGHQALPQVAASGLADAVDAFCEGIRELIRRHPYTRKDYFHVYLNDMGESALEILINIFHEAPDWGTELRERQRFLLDDVYTWIASGIGDEFVGAELAFAMDPISAVMCLRRILSTRRWR